jgi:hypothetical protein
MSNNLYKVAAKFETILKKASVDSALEGLDAFNRFCITIKDLLSYKQYFNKMLKSVDFYDDAHTKLTDLLEQFALAENLLNKADRKVFDGKWRFAGRYEQAMSSGENKDFSSNIKECVKKIKDLGVSLVDEDQKSGGKASFLFGSNFKKFVSNLDSSIAFTSYNGDFPVIAEPMEYDRSKGTVLKEKSRKPGSGFEKSPGESPRQTPKGTLDSSEIALDTSEERESSSSIPRGETESQRRSRLREERLGHRSKGVTVVGDKPYEERYNEAVEQARREGKKYYLSTDKGLPGSIYPEDYDLSPADRE